MSRSWAVGLVLIWLLCSTAYGEELDLLVSPGPEGQQYFALALKAPAAQAEARALDLALVVDTSADQMGEGWQKAVTLAKAVVDGLQGGSRVQLWSSTSPQKQLAERPAAVGSETLTQALDGLQETAPVGHSDLAGIMAALDHWLTDRSGTLPKAVVILGDCWPASDVPPATIDNLAERMVQSRATLHWVAMQQMADNVALSSLVARTGGRLYASLTDGQVDELLAGLSAPVLYEPQLRSISGVTVLPAKLPPLRHDVATLVAGRCAGTLPSEFVLTGKRNGESKHWTLPVAENHTQGQGYLQDLVERWEQTPQVPLLYPAPVALQTAQSMAALQTEQVLAQAKAAISQRNLERAEELYQWVAKVEPNSVEAAVGIRAVAMLRQQPQPEPAKPVTESSPQPDLLEEAKNAQRVEAQRLGREVSEAIRMANRLSRISYEDAIRLLKQTLATIDASTMLSEDQKAGLRRRLETQLRTLWRSRQRAELDQLQRDQALAQVANRKRDEQTRQLRELTAKELMSRYRALLDEGNYPAAAATASQVREVVPDSVAAAASELRADIAHSYAVNEDFEHRARAGWIRTAQSAQYSAIPMPDEPPIIYPPAKVWEELTIRRQKYNVIDLAPVTPAEEKVRQALTRPVSFDFQETPLSDVIDFLREYAGINIVLDQNGLDEVQVDADTPVTLQLEQVTLKSALNLILKQFELTYMIRDEVLLITSETQASEELITKVYPVADLVIPIIDFNSGGVGLNGALGGGNAGQGGLGGSGFGGFGGGGGGGFGGAGPAGVGGGGGNLTGGANQAVGNDISEELIELIKSVIDPDSWDSAGGPGAIRKFNHNLVIRSSDKTHEKVAKTNDALRGKTASARTEPTRQQWNTHFAKHRESEAGLRAALEMLASHGHHKQAAMMIKAALRHQKVGDWVYEPLALSLQIAGGKKDEVQQAVLSPVARQPHRLDLRLAAAESLASLGMTRSAIDLLKESARLFPKSANLYYMALDMAESLPDVDTMAWAADQLLHHEWPKQSEAVHQQTRRRLAAAIENLRTQGQVQDAQRLQAVVEEVQIRDLEVTVQWQDDADIDLFVVEPGDLLCGPAAPQTVNGGIIVSDGIGNFERYVCAEAFPGDYDLIIRPVWGQPAGGIVSVDVVMHKGTPQEVKRRYTVRLAENAPVTIHLDNGRRQQQSPIALQEPFLFDGNQKQTGKVPPMVQLRQMIQTGQIEPPPQRVSPRITVGGIGHPLAQLAVNTQVPFVTGATAVASGGAVAFDPTITVVNNGITLTGQAVVSADRRYVRMQLVPVVQTITGVSTQQIIGTAR